MYDVSRITQKECKRLISSGRAIELKEENVDLYRYLKCIRRGYGVYGINCALYEHEFTKQLYAIPRRSSILYYYYY